MIKKLFTIFILISVLCLFISSSVAEDNMPYQEISANYVNIALDTGTDPDTWWNSNESIQAAFGLLVMLDMESVIPEFDIMTSDEYPSLGFGVFNKEKAGIDGAAFAFLINSEKGLYFPVTCDFQNKTLQYSLSENIILTYREAGFYLMTLCEDKWKQISSDSIKEAATFLHDQFTASQK